MNWRLWTGPLMLGTLLAVGACGGDDDDDNGGTGGSAGSGGGQASGGTSGSGGSSGGMGGASGGMGGAAGAGTGGSSGAPTANFTCPADASEQVPLALSLVVDGLHDPLFAVSPPGDSRLFIVEQPGRIRIWDGEGLLLFLDIYDQVVSPASGGDNEQGLLGLAFHPDFAANGRFFVNYTKRGDGPERGNTVIAEFQVSSSDRNAADPTTQKTVLEFDQPQANHNGGMLEFGSDGYLYIGTGDGGEYDDIGAGHAPEGNGQSLATLLGKVLRIDVDGTAVNDAYSIPSGNMTGSGVLPEIFAYGLRNPWRFSFDAPSGSLFIADVGQMVYEEVNLDTELTSGKNYGWPIMEAAECFREDDCDETGLTLPVVQYDHSNGCSITGGYVYRGEAIPELQGAYLYADYCQGNFWAFVPGEDGTATERCNLTANLNPDGLSSITSFGRDANGELYVMVRGDENERETGGRVLRIEAQP